MNAPLDIDTTIDIKIKRNEQKVDKKYKCTCCGNSWDAQKGHFSKSASVLYQANNGYINICNNCRDNLYYQLVDFYNGNEERAIEKMCQLFDWIYHEDALVAARQISSDRSRISHYLAKKNLGQTASIGATYFDTIKFDYKNNQGNIIESREQTKDNNVSVSASAIDRWGIGFAESDYKNMDDHYRMLKRNNPNADNNQEIFIKDLCSIHMLKIRALQNGDSKEYANLVEQYAKTFKQAGLRTVEEKDSSNDKTFCMTLGFISDYTPEEFYQDKSLYSDWDDIGEYIERHITRPMINLETGNDIRDKEYFVPEEDDYDEE